MGERLITPGPWLVHIEAGGFVASAERITICLAPAPPLVNGAKAWPANAQAIAAIPDMLAALDDALLVIGSRPKLAQDGSRNAERMERIHAAIKKARGKA